MASTSNYGQQQRDPQSGAVNGGYESQHPRVPSDSFAARIWAPAGQWYDEMQWTRRKGKSTNKERLELIASYAPDWVLTLVVAGLLQIVNKVYGFRREFSLTDTSIQHTYAIDERISVSLLAVLAFIIPLVLMACISLGISRSVWDFHAGLLGLVVAHAFTLTATTVIKVTVGRPRPDLIDRCKPAQGASNGVPFGLVTEAICTTDVTSHLIQDGFRSFPSGHSSTAFAGLTFFTLWLAGKFHIWQRSRGNAFSAWLLFIPMIGATLIAVSRTMDYRHHATDVIAGAILGFVIALSSYHTYYPPLWHPQSHKPWSPRTTSSAFNHLQQGSNVILDDEEAAHHQHHHLGPNVDDGAGERTPFRQSSHQRNLSNSSDGRQPTQFASRDAEAKPTSRSPSDEVEMSRAMKTQT